MELENVKPFIPFSRDTISSNISKEIDHSFDNNGKDEDKREMCGYKILPNECDILNEIDEEYDDIDEREE